LSGLKQKIALIGNLKLILIKFKALKVALVVLLLIGAVFGIGFKVRILIPATLLTVVLTSSIEIMHGQDLLSSALATTAAVIAIQMGYLIGVVARARTDYGATAARKSGEQRQPGFHRWFSSFIFP
jgi:hypothetical protein